MNINPQIKKIIKITSLVLLCVAIVMNIVCLVNYYNYVSIIKKLTTPSIDLLEKFNLQEIRDSRLYSTLSSLVWSSYITIITLLINVVNFIINKKPKEHKKIR